MAGIIIVGAGIGFVYQYPSLIGSTVSLLSRSFGTPTPARASPANTDEAEPSEESSNGFFEAAYFFITGIDVDEGKMSGNKYRDGEFKFEGASMRTEYVIEKDCFIRKTLTSQSDKSGAVTGSNTTYDFNKLTGQYRYYQDYDLWKNRVYVLNAVGRKAYCNSSDLFDKKLDAIVGVGCYDNININYSSPVVRDRAINAFKLIMDKYCKPIAARPF